MLSGRPVVTRVLAACASSPSRPTCYLYIHTCTLGRLPCHTSCVLRRPAQARSAWAWGRRCPSPLSIGSTRHRPIPSDNRNSFLIRPIAEQSPLRLRPDTFRFRFRRLALTCQAALQDRSQTVTARTEGWHVILEIATPRASTKSLRMKSSRALHCHIRILLGPHEII